MLVALELQSADLKSIPRVPGAIPLVGHALKVWRDPLEFLKSLPAHGDLVRLNLGTLPVYVVTSTELAYQVMATKARSFEKGRFFDRVRPFAGNGLANSDGEFHRKHRRLIQPMFSKERIAQYSEIMGRKATEMVESWKPGDVVEIQKEVTTYGVETLAETLFSTGVDKSLVDTIHRNLPVLMKNMLLRAASPKILDRVPVRPNREFDTASANLRKVIDDVILASRAAGGTDRKDLLTLLLAAQDSESGEGLTDTEVRDELTIILYAGVETTAATISWTMHHLAGHPEEEKKLVAEILEVVGDRPVTIEDVPRLPGVRRVVDEVIRLHGVTLLMRRATEPVELGGYLVPPGTEIALSPYAIHRDGRVYENPDAFDPDRWLPERQKAAGLEREHFIPFGAGSHKCIGDIYAYTEATIALVTMLSRWRLAPVAGHTPTEVAATVPVADRVAMVVQPRRP
ncbi:cytochrome P450 [Streptomyces sp. NPDC004609]|uniref:cytochrome P450 n=1 Tax=Streptomyces sp. NPDC004609 TaxID=3364704 RepID=UPI0036902203